MPGLNFLASELAHLEESSLLRRLRTRYTAMDRRIQLDQQWVLNFASNDYLGLASHPATRRAAVATIEESGVGSGASRLIVGNCPHHEKLELSLASFLQRPAALLFSSGYHANTGVIPALMGPEDVIFSDQLNHASIIDGCRLSRARVQVFPHRDTGRLAELLAAIPARRRLIVSDAVFSMDGDEAPVRELAALADQHDAIFMLDEAHSVGVTGPGGRGLAARHSVVPDVLVGTLGKAAGSYGAFAAGTRELVHYLLNRSRSFIFTTGLPPAIAAASRAALDILESGEGEQLRRQLESRIHQFREGLSELDLLAEGVGTSPIFPVITGAEEQTMRCCQLLLERGVYAQGIRPPTVPAGTARLRFALMATHTQADVKHALDALRELRGCGAL